MEQLRLAETFGCGIGRIFGLVRFERDLAAALENEASAADAFDLGHGPFGFFGQSFRADFGKFQKQAEVLIGLVKGEPAFRVEAAEDVQERKDFLGRDENGPELTLVAADAIQKGQRRRVVAEGRGYLSSPPKKRADI